jgi:hypothetical protein
VALNNVIVFRFADDAATNPVLWSHELKHIQQFAEWGVRDFAIRYLRDWNSVEAEAYAAERAFQAEQVRGPVAGDFDGNGRYDEIGLLIDTIVVFLNGSNTETRTFINRDYNTKLGIWLVLDVNRDRCADLAHIITSRADRPHYVHTHVSNCDGSFRAPDMLRFNAPGVANPQGDYDTSLGFWSVKYCRGMPVMAHNPLLPDGRNHFWYPQINGPYRYSLSNECH